MKKFLILLFSLLLLTSCSSSQGKVINETPRMESTCETTIEKVKPTTTISQIKTSTDVILSESEETTVINQGCNEFVNPYYNNNATRYDMLYPVNLDNMSMYIDRQGNIVSEGDYDSCSSFQEGISIVKKGDYYGAVDLTGQLIIPCVFEELHPCSCGLLLGKKYDLYGYINNKGKVIIQFKYDKAYDFSENIAVVDEIGDHFDFIDTNGKVLCEMNYYYSFFDPEYINDIGSRSFHDGLMQYRNYYVNIKGKLAFTPKCEDFTDYHYPTNFSEGLAAYPVSIKSLSTIKEEGSDDTWQKFIADGNWYFIYINSNGNDVFNKKFERADTFSEGMAVVTLNGKTGCIDKAGNFVYYNDYVYGQYAEGYIPFSNGKEQSLKYGFLDKQGNTAIPAQYDNILLGFTNGLALVETDGKLAYINSKNDIIYKFDKPNYSFWNY